jgi:hypothetical protein
VGSGVARLEHGFGDADPWRPTWHPTTPASTPAGNGFEGATRAAALIGTLMTLPAVLDERTPYRLPACQAELTAWARRLFLS